MLADDLITDEGVVAVEKRIGGAGRPIDLLVNNAGFGSSGYFDESEASRLDDEIELNIRALSRFRMRRCARCATAGGAGS